MGVITQDLWVDDGAVAGGIRLTTVTNPNAYGLAVWVTDPTALAALTPTDYYDGTIVIVQSTMKAYTIIAGVLSPLTAAPDVNPAWTAVTVFTDNWSNNGAPWAPAAFRKVGDMVQVRAGIKRTTALAVPITSPVFTLPVGYRPPYNASFWAMFIGNANWGSPGRVNVAASGVVNVVTSTESGANASGLTAFEFAFSTT